MRRALALAVTLLFLPALAWGQPELRTGAKGTKGAGTPTSTAVDANTQALDVTITGTPSVTPLQAATLVDLPDVTVTGSATLLRAANTTRLVFSCTVGTASGVRVGGGNTTPARGQSVAARASFKTTTTDAVYAASEGVDVTVSCAEELQ